MAFFSLDPQSYRSYLKMMRLTNIAAFMSSFFLILRMPHPFGVSKVYIDGKVNLFPRTFLVIYRAHVKYYKWGKNMLKIHSETNFSQTRTNTHTPSECGTLYVPLQKWHDFLYRFIHTHVLYLYINIWGMKYLRWRGYVVQRYQPNSLIWCWSWFWHIQNRQTENVSLSRKFTLVLQFPMDENAYVCVRVCLCFICFV